MSRARVDVVLATHQGAAYLPAQLAGIEEQIEPPNRLVAVDDASSDETVAILTALSERTDLAFTVDLTRQVARSGSRAAFATALTRSDGDIVVLCDQDDVWRPDRVAVAVAAIQGADDDVVLTVSDAALMDERGHRLAGTVRGRLAGHRRARDPAHDRVIRAVIHPACPGATLAFTAALRDLALPLPESILNQTASLEHDGWIVALAEAGGRVLELTEELVTYRLHPGQQIGLGSDPAGLGILRIRQIARRDPRLAEQLSRRAASAKALAVRLRERERGDPQTLAALEEMVTHLEWRRSVPAIAVARGLREVRRELRSRRYARFSSGRASALVDLARILRGP